MKGGIRHQRFFCQRGSWVGVLFSVLVECNFSTEQTICLVANLRDQLVPFGKRPSLGMDKDVERLNPSRLPIVKCCPVILSCREM